MMLATVDYLLYILAGSTTLTAPSATAKRTLTHLPACEKLD